MGGGFLSKSPACGLPRGIWLVIVGNRMQDKMDLWPDPAEILSYSVDTLSLSPAIRSQPKQTILSVLMLRC